MQALQIDEDKKSQVLENSARLESEHLRNRRNKMSVDTFEQLDIIGRGAFGEVRLVREHDSGQVYAMKKLRKSEMVSKGQVCVSAAPHLSAAAPRSRTVPRARSG